MDTFLDLQTAVMSDLTIGPESTLYSLTQVKLAINRAYRKGGGLFPWSDLRDAKKTTTVTGHDYYGYPQNWRSDSIWKLKIDDVRYGEDPDGSPLSFDDFLNWKEDNPNSTDKKWANQSRKYWVSPTPTQDNLIICIWGIRVVDLLVNDSDVTIFSYSSPEGNEAVVLEAVAILKSKGEEEKLGEFRSVEAKQLLATLWGKTRIEQSKFEKNQPFFEVPDLFARNGTGLRKGVNMTGRF